LRAAERVAQERGAIAIVTGDAIGQVSSQTLQNIAVISQATTLPVLRPLVGSNKNEILEVAQQIGTYEASKEVGEYCALVPRKPATSAALAVVAAQEARLDENVFDRALRERAVFDLRRLDLASLEAPEIETRVIPVGAVVLDLRSKAAFQSWHYPGALYLDFPNAMRVYPQLDSANEYVLYCEFGLKSAHLAEVMREAGFEARHFAGGLKQLFAYARANGIATPDV
jgi:thiamine biosynthesis protein ThiI